MHSERQTKTKAVYEDPEIVAGYREKHAKNPKLYTLIESFAKDIPGKTVLDLGCGPGQDAYHFAELGYTVTGLDYSSAMIDAARTLRHLDTSPTFMVGDMRELQSLFLPDSFAAVWATASLIHIPEAEVPGVLNGIHSVTKNQGKVAICLKAGPQGAQVVKETKYGKPMEREFIYWEKDLFTTFVTSYGFHVDGVLEQQVENNSWLNFFLTVEK